MVFCVLPVRLMSTGSEEKSLPALLLRLLYGDEVFVHPLFSLSSALIERGLVLEQLASIVHAAIYLNIACSPVHLASYNSQDADADPDANKQTHAAEACVRVWCCRRIGMRRCELASV